MESWIEKTNASEDEKEDLTKDDYNPRAAFGRRGLQGINSKKNIIIYFKTVKI